MFWNENWNTWNEDWSNHGPSSDQHRINEFLSQHGDKNKRVLIVGSGDSSFAIELCSKFKEVVSITVLSSEIKKSEEVINSYKLQNYSNYLCNKHTYDFLTLPGTFEYISDNGLFTFSDCKICYYNVLQFYVQKLSKNGMILTDTLGLYFAKQFTVEKLKNFVIEAKIPLELIEFKNGTHYVVGLKKV